MAEQSEQVERCGWCSRPAVTHVKIANGNSRGNHFAPVCAAREACFAEQGVVSELAKVQSKKKVYKGPKLGWR